MFAFPIISLHPLRRLHTLPPPFNNVHHLSTPPTPTTPRVFAFPIIPLYFLRRLHALPPSFNDVHHLSTLPTPTTPPSLTPSRCLQAENPYQNPQNGTQMTSPTSTSTLLRKTPSTNTSNGAHRPFSMKNGTIFNSGRHTKYNSKSSRRKLSQKLHHITSRNSEPSYALTVYSWIHLETSRWPRHFTSLLKKNLKQTGLETNWRRK